MKRLMSISLVIVLVLAIGAMAFADEGSLKGGATLGATIPVEAKIGPYAQVIGGRPVNFGELEGKVGIYTANGFDHGGIVDQEFYGRVKGYFNNAPFAGNNNGWGSFFVESNTDVSVCVQFEPIDWLESPSRFAVAMAGAPDDPLAWFDETAGSFSHLYSYHALTNNKDTQYPTAVLYGIDGAIWLQHISQQQARYGEQNYTGTIKITVSK